MQWISSKIFLMDTVNFSLSVCIISFFGKILEHEIFQVKVGTLKMNPILEDIQIWHKTRTTHANYLFEGVNHIVFMGLTDEKKTTTSNYQYFWSCGPISLHIFGHFLQLWPCFWTITLEPRTQISCF